MTLHPSDIHKELDKRMAVMKRPPHTNCVEHVSKRMRWTGWLFWMAVFGFLAIFIKKW